MKESQEPSVLTKTAPSSKKPPMSKKKKIILWTIIGVLIVAIAVTVPLVVVSRNNKQKKIEAYQKAYLHAHFQTAKQDGISAKPIGKGKYKLYDRNGNFMKDFWGDAHLALPEDDSEHTYYFYNGILDTTQGITYTELNPGEKFYYNNGRLMESNTLSLDGGKTYYWVYGGLIQYDKTGNYRIFEDGNTIYKVVKGQVVGHYENGSYVSDE